MLLGLVESLEVRLAGEHGLSEPSHILSACVATLTHFTVVDDLGPGLGLVFLAHLEEGPLLLLVGVLALLRVLGLVVVPVS